MNSAFTILPAAQEILTFHQIISHQISYTFKVKDKADNSDFLWTFSKFSQNIIFHITYSRPGTLDLILCKVVCYIVCVEKCGHHVGLWYSIVVFPELHYTWKTTFCLISVFTLKFISLVPSYTICMSAITGCNKCSFKSTLNKDFTLSKKDSLNWLHVLINILTLWF